VEQGQGAALALDVAPVFPSAFAAAQAAGVSVWFQRADAQVASGPAPVPVSLDRQNVLVFA
jgi:hypothetical protein